MPRLPEFLILGFGNAVQKAREELKVLIVLVSKQHHNDDQS
ncbi:uncharacterized protein VP01_2000g3 [Puccinia sorghi]|uniref:Uncharacterized protein n=1 Tax=Puccinia sorghi TaxID=27349 RepID=A0A0L6VBZ0_9BASI|nr:uncharacterized protein VP01_2000g3 [Puccinia sorghi]